MRKSTLPFRIFFILLYMSLGLWSGHAQAQSANFDVEGHTDAAQDYMAHKQWDFANYEWRTILANDNKNVTAYLNLAECLRQAGLLQEAITELEKARGIVKDTHLEESLGLAYEMTGNLPKAAEIYQTILIEKPYEPVAFQYLQNLLPKLPDAQKQAASQLLAQQAQACLKKGKEAIRAGQYKDAANYYQIASIFYQTFGKTNDYGLALFLAGNLEGAARQFDSLNQKNERYCKSNANIALVYLSAGQTTHASKTLEKAISNCDAPQLKPQLFNNLGYIYEMSHNLPKAQYAYEHALELKPSFTKAQMNLGYVLQRRHDWEKTIALYQQVVQREPNNAQAWNMMGLSYELQDKPKLAFQAYKRAIQANSRLKEAYYNLGVLYRKEGKMKEADATFKQMAQLEFSDIEHPASAAQVSVQDKQSELFDYVDLFFAEPVL